MPDNFDLNTLTDQELEQLAADVAERRKPTPTSSDSGGSQRRRETGARRFVQNSEAIQSFEERFNTSTRGSAITTGGEPLIDQREARDYVAAVLGARAAKAMADTSANPNTRKAYGDLRPQEW